MKARKVQQDLRDLANPLKIMMIKYFGQVKVNQQLIQALDIGGAPGKEELNTAQIVRSIAQELEKAGVQDEELQRALEQMDKADDPCDEGDADEMYN